MKNIFLMSVLVFFSNAQAMVSGPGPGWGMEVDHESLGIGGSGKFPSEVIGESRGATGTFGPGGAWGMEVPRELSIPTERTFRMNEFSREMAVVDM